jgi:hypothetical protein
MDDDTKYITIGEDHFARILAIRNEPVRVQHMATAMVALHYERNQHRRSPTSLSTSLRSDAEHMQHILSLPVFYLLLNQSYKLYTMYGFVNLLAFQIFADSYDCREQLEYMTKEYAGLRNGRRIVLYSCIYVIVVLLSVIFYLYREVYVE